MPVERQEQMLTMVFGNATGGMNTAVPPTQLADNEVQWLENYEYDYNLLRTRGGLSEPIVTIDEDINNFYYDAINGAFLIYTTNRRIYYVKGETTNMVGVLNGDEDAVTCKFGNEFYIASGDKLQVFDGEEVSTIESSYLCDNVFERSGRLVTTHRGDDNLYFSSVGDAKSEVAWIDDSNDDSTAKWVEVGYKDDGDIITCKPLAQDLLVFKTNGRIYSLSGDYPSWVIQQVGERSMAEDRLRSIEVVGDSVAFITRAGIRDVSTVQSYGNFQLGEVGYKINNTLAQQIFEPTCWNVITKRQLVIAPNRMDMSTLFVYQYNMQAGYVLTFPYPIVDIADTLSGVIVACGKSLHRWGFDYKTDNGIIIQSRLKSRAVQTVNKFFTRKWDIDISGGEDAAVLFSCGKQSWVFKVKDRRKVKHIYDTMDTLTLEISSHHAHTINNVVLYSLTE